MGEDSRAPTSLRSATSNALLSHGRLISSTDSRSEGNEGVREIPPHSLTSLILYFNRIDAIDMIGYRCATDGIVMSSYEPVKNPL